MDRKKNTVATLLEMKKNGEKVSMLTCYDYTTARIMENAGINTILVGDSLGMTMQGYDTEIVPDAAVLAGGGMGAAPGF